MTLCLIYGPDCFTRTVLEWEEAKASASRSCYVGKVFAGSTFRDMIFREMFAVIVAQRQLTVIDCVVDNRKIQLPLSSLDNTITALDSVLLQHNRRLDLSWYYTYIHSDHFLMVAKLCPQQLSAINSAWDRSPPWYDHERLEKTLAQMRGDTSGLYAQLIHSIH